MRVPFQFIGLEVERFSHLLSLNDLELAEHGGRWLVVDAKPGYPCRVSLIDADVGERVLAIPFVHHDVATPYRASGPIFVREHARSSRPAPNDIPLMFHHRLLSIRAYDATGMMVDASVVEGSELDVHIQSYLAMDRVAYLHLHNASPGCYNCRVERA